jgi:hypothetical protein
MTMSRLSTTFRRVLATSLVAVLTTLAGCSDDGLGKRYSVYGKVTYKGQPLEKGLISFIAAAPDGRSAMGIIKDGYYKLTTQEPEDGAFAGDYAVTIAARVPEFAEAEDKAKKKGNTSAYIPMDFTAEANKKAKNSVPDKYSLPATSGLKASVKAQSNEINFELTD